MTAVQAIVSAGNYGIKVPQEVLDKGFEYLKKCQNADGGFDYMLDKSTVNPSMKEGTAADVATLALMKKFDHAVMMNACKYLIKLTPQGISQANWPYYGHFYGCMGMRLLGQEMKTLRLETSEYIASAQKDVIDWQGNTGAWPVKAWVSTSTKEGEAYATAFATMLLSVDDGRLSIYNRTPPKLPKEAASKPAQ